MGRIRFLEGQQTVLITSVLKRHKTTVKELAQLCSVSERTIRDWRREKFSISEFALRTIQKHFRTPVPKVTLLNDYWYAAKGARNGGLRRLALYGPPGTKEGRQKGGRISQLRRKQFPERYPNCPIPRHYSMPPMSKDLAELVGIVLGDGGLVPNQLKITLNSQEEPEYIRFVARLMLQLFHVRPSIYLRKKEKACNVSLAGVQLVEVLGKIGIYCGNKVKRQVKVPSWIWEQKEYAQSCLRGLIDTDGCVYHHNHISHGVHCFNLGLTFSNHSEPLVDFVFQTLLSIGVTAKRTDHGVFVYRRQDVDYYFSTVGSHNAHHLQRYRNFATIKATRRDTQVV